MGKADEIKQLGEAFRGRLEHHALAGALDYVDFGECGLSIEFLCDQLYESGVALSHGEYEWLSRLAEVCGADAERVTLLERYVS